MKHTLSDELSIRRLTNASNHHFFGFYDVSPWSEDGKYVLAHGVDFINKMPSEGDTCRVGFIDSTTGDAFRVIGETKAWNFQQGARLQWVPGKGTRFAYNIRERKDFGSVIHDITSGDSRQLPHSIYAIDPKGEYALTPNFARLQDCGGYGYLGGKDSQREVIAPREDGILKLDLATGESELLISLQAIAETQGGAPVNMEKAHYVTHMLYNPSGTRFCFLHRFWLRDGGWVTRLCTLGADGKDLRIIGEGNLSHFDWLDDERVMIWGRYRPMLQKMRQKGVFRAQIFRPVLSFIRSRTRGFLRNRILGDRLLVFHDGSNFIENIGLGSINEDGHFSRLHGTPWILGDTYANETHMRSLYLYNLDTQKKIDVGTFYALPDGIEISEKEPWELSGMRSDLHPRWSRDGREVCIDSVHGGTRQMYSIDVSRIIKK